jgi:hypothetical protein
LVALANFMRLSLLKAAYAVVSSSHADSKALINEVSGGTADS